MKACTIVSDGRSSRFDIRDVAVPEPKAGEVLVRVRASAMNRGEIIVGFGAYGRDKVQGDARPAGTEAAGEIEKLGAGVTGFRAGERVMGRCRGGFAEYAIFDQRELMRVPERMSWEEAAAVPITFAVTYDMLVTYGRLQAGEWLLVTAVSSGVGVACLQMAKALGAKVIGTSGSAAKLDKLRALGLDLGLQTTKGDFVDAVMKATEGKGVDVVVNNVGGSVFPACQQSLGYRGRFATVGYVDGVMKAEIDIEAMHTKRHEFFGVSNRLRSAAERGETIQGFARDLLPRFADGTIRPVIDRVFPFDELPAAKTHMEANAHLGKIVIRMP